MQIGINAWFLRQETTGSGQYLRHLLSEFAAVHNEFQYTLFVNPAQPGEASWLELPQQRFLQITLTTPFDRQSENMAKFWFEQLAIPRAARKLGLDLIHVPYWGSPLFSSTPVIVTIHDLIPLLLPAYRASVIVRAYTRLVAAAARQADFILTDSVASQRDIVQHLGIPANRVRAVHLAHDAHFGSTVDAKSAAALQRKYNLPDRYLLYLGGFDRRKNLPRLLRAFARVLKKQSDARLVVAGKLPKKDSSLFPNPQRIARELNIGEAVQFIGWVPEKDKPMLYAGAIAFIFPSRYEGFGLPPLEAMACGTPVIGSTAASLPEVIGPGGLLVEPDDVSALSEAILSLWLDAGLGETLSQYALKQAAAFSWSKTASQTLQAFEQTLSNTR